MIHLPLPTLAMQKVVGSSPINRSDKAPLMAGFSYALTLAGEPSILRFRPAALITALNSRRLSPIRGPGL